MDNFLYQLYRLQQNLWNVQSNDGNTLVAVNNKTGESYNGSTSGFNAIFSKAPDLEAGNTTLGVPDAVGDGTRVDSLALAAAIAAAGVNGQISLTPGSIYLVDRSIRLLAGQTLLGNGATLKRLAQTTSSTNTVITSGVTYQIDLTPGDGSKFKVGQSIAVYNGANYAGNNVITDITGDTLTSDTSFSLSAGSPWSGATTVVLSFDTVLTANENSILGVIFDGNYSTYSKYRWELTSEIHQFGTNVVIDSCFFKDVPGEGIQESSAYSATTSAITSGVTTSIVLGSGQGALHRVGRGVTMVNGSDRTYPKSVVLSISGDTLTFETPITLLKGSSWSGTTTVYPLLENCHYTNNRLQSLNGNGIHFSASSGSIVSGNHIQNTNLQSATMGHEGGNITFSTQISDARITNNYLALGRCAVGQLDGNSALNTIIKDNIIVNPWLYGVESIMGTADDVLSGLTIEGNTFHSGKLAGTGIVPFCHVNVTNGGTTVMPSRIHIKNNTIYYTAVPSTTVNCLMVNKANNVLIDGNSFEFAVGDTKSVGILAGSTRTLTVSKNTVKGGQTALIPNSGGQAVVNASISANVFDNQYSYGIFTSGGTNILVSENVITAGASADAGSYQGLCIAGAGIQAKSNTFDFTVGYCGIRIYGIANIVAQGNTIRAPGAGKCIKIESGSTGYVVTNNQVNYAIVDTPAAGVRISDNDVIT